MNIIRNTLLFIALPAILAACSPEAAVPTNATLTKDVAEIYPDYRDIVIPSNIAPLNIQVKSGGEEFVGVIEGKGGQTTIAAAKENGKLLFDSLEWRKLLTDNQGGDLKVTLYSNREGQWLQHPSYKLTVAEPIDRYLSYRLIEPSYELYRQLGLYQRDLSTFDEQPIYENNRTYQDGENHCINCHNYQNYDTKRMLFHVRASHGGTIFVQDGKARKFNMKADSVLSSTVYPTWHPRRNWVVFSSNLTGQAFHMLNKQKIEVLDYGSDLVFFDADKNTLTNILKTDQTMETFPCWAPDGKKLYYCAAEMPLFAGRPDSIRQDIVMARYDSIHYNVMSMTFDEETRTFGEPVLEVDCAAQGLSATVPRVSPDGRYLLFTLGDFGQFHIWHKTSDQYIKDLQTGEVRPLTAANSPDVDSYHSWSSNGRWFVFSSRRDDGSYTRPYIAYFDKNGQAHKAFLLPQEDPEQNILLLKSYNVPELTRTAVKTTPEQLREVIYNDNDVQKVTYKTRP